MFNCFFTSSKRIIGRTCSRSWCPKTHFSTAAVWSCLSQKRNTTNKWFGMFIFFYLPPNKKRPMWKPQQLPQVQTKQTAPKTEPLCQKCGTRIFKSQTFQGVMYLAPVCGSQKNLSVEPLSKGSEASGTFIWNPCGTWTGTWTSIWNLPWNLLGVEPWCGTFGKPEPLCATFLEPETFLSVELLEEPQAFQALGEKEHLFPVASSPQHCSAASAAIELKVVRSDSAWPQLLPEGIWQRLIWPMEISSRVHVLEDELIC